MIKILLLIDYSSEFDRKLLRGLVQYSKENGPWLFYRLPSYYSGMYGEKGILKWAKEWKADAIIGQWNNDTVNLLKELNIPIVLQNYHHRSTTYSNLTGDYKGTGRMAAQFFAKRMFHNFAYFGINGVVWSDERCEGFRQEVKRIGGNFYCFESDKHEDEIRIEVSQWLQELPKPIALSELRSPFPVPSVSHNITADVRLNSRRQETTPVIFSFSFHLPDRVPIPDAKPLFHIFHSCKGAIRHGL